MLKGGYWPQQCTQNLLAAGGNEGRKAPFKASLQIELFARVPKTRMNTGLQELWHKRERELPQKRVKHKIKPQNTKIRYENTANTKGFTDGQT